MTKLSYLESGFSCVPFLLPVTELGIDMYRTRLLKDPAAMLPHVLRIEGVYQRSGSVIFYPNILDSDLH